MTLSLSLSQLLVLVFMCKGLCAPNYYSAAAAAVVVVVVAAAVAVTVASLLLLLRRDFTQGIQCSPASISGTVEDDLFQEHGLITMFKIFMCVLWACK